MDNNGKPPVFVVIDDSATAIKIVELALKDCPLKLVSFSSAIEATPYLIKHQPDLIILDIVMPEKDGLTFLEEIRKQNHKKTPVIMFTSKDYQQDRLVSSELGAIDYIVKPVLSKELKERIVKASGLGMTCQKANG